MTDCEADPDNLRLPAEAVRSIAARCGKRLSPDAVDTLRLLAENAIYRAAKLAAESTTLKTLSGDDVGTYWKEAR